MSDTEPALTRHISAGDGSDLAAEDTGVADSQPSSRRRFLRRLVVGGGLALGVGGIAAYIVDQQRTTVIVLPNGDAVEVPPGVAVGDTMGLINELAALREALAENDAERRSLGDQLAEAQVEIDALNADRDGLLSLVDLYEAMDATGLDEVVANGMAGVSVALTGASGLIDLLETGIGIGLSALGELVDDLPGPQAGLVWLKGEVSALLLNLQSLEQGIEEAIAPVGTFAATVAEFVLDVLRKLPFGLGNPARSGLEAMQTVITGLPLLTDGITLDVLDPLDGWFGQDNKTNVIGKLVRPIEDDLITPATGTVDAVSGLSETYENELVTPTETALGERAEIRAEIDAQRASLNAGLVARGRRRQAS